MRSEILSYLEHQPHASDTVDGIIDWWLFRQRLRIGRATVLTALEQLVASGQIDKRVLSSATVVYARAADPPGPQAFPQPDKE